MASNLLPPDEDAPEEQTPQVIPAASSGIARTKRNVIIGTLIMMGGILGSRILGLVRDRIITHKFGQTAQTDIYNSAFNIPDLVFFLLAGGALSAAFVPVFTEYWEKGEKKEAWRVFSVVAFVMTCVLSLVILLCEIFAVPLVRKTNPGWEEWQIIECARLTQILLPAQLCFFLGGLMMGTLTARNIFIGQSLGPVIYNLGIIAGGLFLTGKYGVTGLCYGAVGGALIGNFCYQWYLVRKSGGRFVYQDLFRHLRHPGAIRVWKLMLPVIFGLALPQISIIIGRIFAAALDHGAQSALTNANRLMQVPLGVFAQATAIAIFPTMAAQAARGEMRELRDSVSFGIRSILFLTVPASVLMMVLALPIVQLILQSGKFSTADAEVTASVLRVYSIGIFASSVQSILARGFYAVQDTKTPVAVGAILTLLFLPLNVPFRVWAGINGLALVISLCAISQMLVMMWRLRLKLQGMEGGRIARSAVKILIASLVMGAVAFGVQRIMEQTVGVRIADASPRAAVTLGISLTVSLAVYLATAVALRMDEVAVLRRMTKKFRKS
jgi:putative peptidoglycan lipid II flippase